MQDGDLAAHTRALLLRGCCPACAEPLAARSLFGAAPCTRCDAAIDPAFGGARLASQLRERGRRRLIAIVLAVGLAHLVLGWIPLAGAVTLVLAAAWIRLGILQPISAMLSPRRRVLTRWTARLVMAAAVAVTVIAVEALTLVPILGLPIKALLGALEVAIAAWAVTAYVHWQLEREAAGEAIASWEWLVLGLCVAALIASVFALTLALVWLASALDGLLGWLS